MLEYNDILFATVNPYQQNNLIFKETDGVYVASTGYAQIKPLKINPEYLYYYLHTNTFLKNVLKRCTGTCYPAISIKDLKTMNIQVSTIEEQNKIASFISSVDKKISLMKQKHKKYMDMKQYLLQNMFCNKEKKPKLRFPEFKEEWKETKLSTVGTVQDGTHFTPSYTEEGVPFFSVETITNNVPPRFISKEEHEKLIKRCKPEQGDILITRIGTLCKPRLVTWNYEFSIYVSLALISSIKINAEYLNQYMLTENYKKDYLRKSLLLASPQKINMKDLKETLIEFPSKAEQDKIAELLTKIDKKINLIEEINNWMKLFKMSLLQKIFG